MKKKTHECLFKALIYDQLESPVLWVGNNPDSSDQGKSLAIPVEYVREVIEIKSAFNRKSAKQVVEQLLKLKPLLARVDPPNSREKLYLPANFFCATVFFELRKEDEKDSVALDELVEATMIWRFFGGIILRAEAEYKGDAGKIFFRNENIPTQAGINTSLAFWATSKSLKYREDEHFSLLLSYSETYFSEFAFDILALLKGTYHPHVLSSLYCIGTTSQENGSCSETRYDDPEAVKRYRAETAAILKAKGYEGFEPLL